MAKRLVALATQRKREHQELRQKAWDAMRDACNEVLFASPMEYSRTIELSRRALALAEQFELADAKRQRARQP